MTNKTNTFPKLTTAQERAWQLVLDWHDEFVQHASDPAEYFISNSRKRGITRNVIPGTEATFNALVKKGMLVRLEHPNNHGWGHYSIHPDFVPEYFDDEPTTPAPEPAPAAAWHERAAWAVSDVPEPPQSIEDMVEPAAAPAQPSDTPNADTIRAIWKTYFEMVDEGYAAFAANMINKRRLSINHPLFDEIGNEVRAEWKARHNLNTPELQPVNNAPVYHTVLLPDTFVAFQAREDIEIVRHNSKKDEDGTLIHVDYRVKADAQPAPVEPNPQDEYIQDLENALGSALVNGKTYLREVDRLVAPYEGQIHDLVTELTDALARVKELETENADLRADMERLAVREMELLQQNSVLFHSLDRVATRNITLETTARDACAEYGSDSAEDAMHTLADTIGYPWNERRPS